MRIGIDGGCLANRRGFGRFARQVLQSLGDAGAPHEFVVFVDRPSLGAVAGAIPEEFETVSVAVGEAPARAASSTGRRKFGDMLAMGRAAARARLDLMFFPASYSYFPVWNVGRVVVTMHDTLALARPELVFPTWQGRMAWAVKEHLAARRADLILTGSAAARRDLLAWFRLPAARVRVVPEGPDPVFGPRPDGPASAAALARHGLDPVGRFFLDVGGLSPHKNLPRLIEAFARSGLAADGFTLALVGDFGDVFHTHVPELRAAVARWGLGSAVVFTGFVPDDDLVFLYNRAEALVQPSLMEGFGLPPVEAMACGTPVLASTAGSLPEVVGGGGLFFEPTEVAAMAESLRRLVDSPWLRADLASRAREGARQFTRKAVASALLDAFEGLAPERPRARPRPVAELPRPWRRSA
jgi:glycosyltransferase involved in cell wall biosynthesis